MPKRERQRIKNLDRISLGKVIQEMIGSPQKRSDAFASLVGTVCHQTIQLAVADWKSSHCEERGRQSLDRIFCSASSNKLHLIKNAISNSRVSNPDRDGIFLNIEKLSSLTPAAIKYHTEIGKKSARKESRHGMTLMFTVDQVFPQLDFKRIADVCRPSIIQLSRNKELLENALFIEEKALLPTLLLKAIVTLFDFRFGNKVIDLKSFDPARVDQEILKIITFANAHLAAITNAGFTSSPDIWGLNGDVPIVHIAHSNPEKFVLAPGDHGVVLSFNINNPRGQITKVTLTEESIREMTKDFNQAVGKLSGL